MNDIYQRKYGLLELGKLTIDFLIKKVLAWLPLVLLYLAALAYFSNRLFTHIVEVANKSIAFSPSIIAFIDKPNASNTQIFVLLRFVLLVAYSVAIPVVINLVAFTFVHNLVALWLFSAQEFYVRQTKNNIVRLVFHTIEKIPSLIITNLMFWLYYFIIFLVFLAILLASQFMPGLTWVKQMYLPLSLFVSIFAIDWSYCYQAVYKYAVSGHKALRYSSLLIKSSFVDTVIWVSVSGSGFLLLVWLFINKLTTVEIPEIVGTLTLTLVVLVLYNFITKFYSNFLFISTDYLNREKHANDEIYKDLLAKRVAPIKKITKVGANKSSSRKDIRAKTAGSTMRHRYVAPEVIETPEVVEEKPKKRKSKKKKVE